MCGHVFMYHDSYPMRRHRPVWQCGTCGRVSSVPLDCCTRPDFAQPSRTALTHILGQWVSAFGRWALARVRPLWHWQRQPASRAGTPPPPTSPAGVGAEGVMAPTAGRDESPEMEDVVVAAGERQ
jgi:hypothetical protein